MKRHEARSDAGFTLVELMIALAIFSLLLATICASLMNVQDQTTNNLTIQELTQSGMLALNEVATEIRDLSNSYDNSVQASDAGDPDILTMSSTQLKFLTGNNIINNDTAGIVDENGGTFTTGCANEMNISLSSGNLVQAQTTPTLSSGQCTWTGTPGSADTGSGYRAPLFRLAVRGGKFGGEHLQLLGTLPQRDNHSYDGSRGRGSDYRLRPRTPTELDPGRSHSAYSDRPAGGGLGRPVFVKGPDCAQTQKDYPNTLAHGQSAAWRLSRRYSFSP